MTHPRTPPKGSVILPTYNRAQFLELTLASFTAQTASDYEIVVVDDGSTDRTQDVLESYARELPLVCVRQPNGGRASARNTAIRAARGDVLIFSDDDRIVVPGFVAAHLAEFPRGDEPKVVVGEQQAILSFIEPGTARQLVSAEAITRRFEATVHEFGLPEPFWASWVEPVIRAFGEELEGFLVPWLLAVTGNLSVPRRRVLDVGAFDEAYRSWGVEDTDLGYKLFVAGARTMVCRAACNYHQVHPRPPERLWWRNLPHFMAKHQAFEIYLWLSACNAGVDYVALNTALREYQELRAKGSKVAEELSRVTRAHAELLVRTGL